MKIVYFLYQLMQVKLRIVRFEDSLYKFRTYDGHPFVDYVVYGLVSLRGPCSWKYQPEGYNAYMETWRA